jgi:hypothetical protein
VHGQIVFLYALYGSKKAGYIDNKKSVIRGGMLAWCMVRSTDPRTTNTDSLSMGSHVTDDKNSEFHGLAVIVCHVRLGVDQPNMF